MRKTAIRAEFEAGEPRIFASRAQLAKRAAQYHPLDGQLVPRSSDAGLLAAIIAGDVPSCSDADWVADKSNRGMYTLGDGATNIRLPDWNGKSAGAIGASVIRGDGTNAESHGVIQSSAVGRHAHNLNLSSDSFGGNKRQSDPLETSTADTRGLRFLASIFEKIDQIKQLVRNEHRGSITASAGDGIEVETRMVNTAGVHAVKR